MLGDVTGSSVTRTITLNANETIAALSFGQATAGNVNELRIQGGGSTTPSTLTVNSLLSLSSTAGTELLFLDNANSGSQGNAVYTGNITAGTNGIIEMGVLANPNNATPPTANVPAIIGNVTIGSGSALNIDLGVSSFNNAVVNGNLTLSGGTMTLGKTTSPDGITLAADGVRFQQSTGSFVASSGVINAPGANTTNNVLEMQFAGTSATFNAGVSGTFFTAPSNSTLIILNSGQSSPTGASIFTLTSGINLPVVNITPSSQTDNITNYTIQAPTSSATLTITGLNLTPGKNAAGTVKAGALELTLGSNLALVSGNNINPSTATGATIILNLNGFTFNQSGHAYTTNSTASNFTIQGGGTLSATAFSLNSNSGTLGTTVSGTTTLQAVGASTAAAGTNNLSNNNLAQTATIDPLSTFLYTGTAVGANVNSITSTRSIGRLAIGDGTHVSILNVGTSALPVGADVTIKTSSTLDLNGLGLTEKFVSGATAGGLSGTGTVQNSVTSTTATLTLDATGGVGSFSGVIKDNTGTGGVVAVALSGSGTQTLSGTDTYSGGTTVNAGLLQMGSASALGATTGALTVGTSATSATLNLEGHSLTVGSLSGTGTGGVITSSVTGGLTVTVNNTAGGATTYAGVIQNGSATSVGVTLGATNTATLTLSGSNSYTGATAISGGQLNVTGSTASGSAFTVAGGAALGGTGTVGGTVQVNAGGGVNQRDGVIGTLTVGNLTLTSGTNTALTFDITSGSTGNLDKLAAGTLTVGGSSGITINVENMAGALTTGTTLTTGTYTLLSYTGAQLSGANFNQFSFTGNTSTLTLDGESLTLMNGANALQLVIATSVTTGTYTLATTVGANVLHVGASTTATTTLTNTGTGQADTLNVTGLGAASTGGTINNGTVNGDPIAQSGTLTNSGQTFTASSTGSQTVTGTVTSVVGDNSTGPATQAGNTAANVFVYSGAGVWTTAGGGSWGTTPTATPANWQANGGIPGITAGFTTTDSASFGDTGFSGTATVTLDGASPFLNAISFNNGTGSYEIAQGTGGLIHLDSTGTATITDTLGNHTISAPMELDSNSATAVSSNSTLTVSGNISEGGGSRSLTVGGLGTTVLSGSNNYSGGTTVNGGAALRVSNTAGSATGTGIFALSAGAALSGTGAINASSFALGGAGTPAIVVVGTGTDSTSQLTLTGSGSNTITNTQLNFNLSAANPGQANVLQVGSSSIAFSNTTLELNMTDVGVVGAYTGYELIAGTSNGQYSGFSTFINGLGQTEILSGGGLSFNFVGQPSNSWYQANSYLIESNGDIEVVVVPEPGTWAMMLGGLAVLVFWQRQRSRSGRS